MIGREDFDWWWSFAPTLKWTWAQSYADTAPHWWIREGRTPGLTRDNFLRPVKVIFTFGEPGKFYGRPNLYLVNPRGNLKCWAMPSDPFVTTDNMHIINLATTDRTYGPQTLNNADRARLDTLALPPGRLSRMGQWLARDLYDDIPQGVPDLDPEDDDE